MRTEYGRDEILAEHAYHRPLVLDGVPCHGGFVAGRYVSPRTLWRAPAIEAWQSHLPAGELACVLDPITARIPAQFPSVAQTKLLVRHGVTVPLVRILSIIAIVEGFGGEVLRLVALPPLGERVLDPIAGTALAHLGALFEAHARDEAGHRRMWELARDIALDRPEIPKDLAPNMSPSTSRAQRKASMANTSRLSSCAWSACSWSRCSPWKPSAGRARCWATRRSSAGTTRRARSSASSSRTRRRTSATSRPPSRSSVAGGSPARAA